MMELRQVLPALSRSQIQVLLRELVREHLVHVHGATRAGLWYPGPAATHCNHNPNYSCTTFAKLIASKKRRHVCKSVSRRTLFLLGLLRCDPLPCLCALPRTLQNGKQAHWSPRWAPSSWIKRGRAIKASGTVRCRRDSPAPEHRAFSRERNSENAI